MTSNTTKLGVIRTDIHLDPDKSRVLIRPFIGSDQRLIKLISRVMTLSETQTAEELNQVILSFSDRHFNIEEIFISHYNAVRHHLILDTPISKERKLLIGSYCTSEYSLESAALFNPSIVPHPDQNNLPEGGLRFVMSLRAVGEGHISSITFRQGIIDSNSNITIEDSSHVVAAPHPVYNQIYQKDFFTEKLWEMGLENEYSNRVMHYLPGRFSYSQLEKVIHKISENDPKLERNFEDTRENLLWVASSNYEVTFPENRPLSSRIIFPNSPSERMGLEDARFVKFDNNGNKPHYYATYTAWNGQTVIPQLLETQDFLSFRAVSLYGSAIKNKGMALFPRKLGGQYVSLSRQDGENIFLLYSDSIQNWSGSIPLLKPSQPWEYLQIGNCGSPIECEEGWLLITHGVGAMRRYCIGAVLLDKENPSKVIGRMRQPLLMPAEYEREGVCTQCGLLLRFSYS